MSAQHAADRDAQGDATAVVEVRGLHFARGSRAIFDGVDLDIRRGAVTAIMGPSGTGKTTMLRLIGGQLRPDSGSVKVEGEEVSRLSREALFRMRKRMGMLFQSGALLTDLSVFDNVAFPIREHTDLPESMVRDLVLMKLEAVGLRGARDLYPRELSGGMARRAALARAIALDPMMILYDEPFAGQDPISMGIIVRLIRRLNDVLGLTSVVVSHDIHETSSIADWIYVIADSRIVGEGTPEDLRRAGSDWVEQFMQGLPDGPMPFHYPAADYAEELLGRALIDTLRALGRWGLRFFQRLGRGHWFLAQVLAALPSAIVRFGLTVLQVWSVGVRSLLIIVVSGTFVGMVLALQGYNTLVDFGAEESLGVVVALSLTRELGPVISALLFAGRAGSALTAEIGLMKATEQLSGMEMMAVDPLRYVVATRFVAGIVSMPLLAAIFTAIGIVGGYFVGVGLLGVDEGAFWSQMQSKVALGEDIVNGVVVKSLVFGFLVTWIAVFEGYDAVPTSEGVSAATTRTVVNASLAVLGSDFVLTALMFN